MFYDPKKKAVKPWVFICFIAAAILSIVIGLFVSKQIAERAKAQQMQAEPDIFKE